MPEEKMSPSSPQLAIVEHQGVAVALSAKEVASIYKKSRQSGIPFDTLEEVYRRGYSTWTPDLKETPTQTAFNRVNSFIAEGAAAAMDSDLINEKRGLWDNIHAKRERIKRGSGERMRKPGEKGAPTAAALKASQVKEEDDIDPNLPGKIPGSSYPTNAPVGTKFGSFIDKDGRKINKYVDQDLTTRFHPADKGDWKPENFPTNAPVGTKYGSFTNKDGKKYNKVVGADLVPNFEPANEEVLPFMSDDKTHSYVTSRGDGKFVSTVVSKDNKQPVDRQAHKSEKDAKNYLVSMSKRKNVSQQGPARLPTPTQPQTKTEERYLGAEKRSNDPNDPSSRFDGDARVYIASTPGQEVNLKHIEGGSKLKTIKRVVKEKSCSCQESVELEEKWSDAKHKSPSGGLTRAGVMAYRRENPGSKLQTAVTTKPSKLKKGSKAAKRRKSFCARMGGMKKRLTSAKTARDPDSRINKALRKWNC